MKTSCTNLRNKSITIKRIDDTFTLDDEEITIKNIFFQKCSGTEEFFNFVLDLGDCVWNKKKVLFLQISWIKGSRDTEDDSIYYNKMNDDCVKICGEHAIELKDSFEGRIDGTFDMAKIYFVNKILISPSVRYFKNIESTEAIFFERMASYQKNFDMTFCNQNSTLTIFTLRKHQLKRLKESFKNIPVFEGGPDRLPWVSIFKHEKKDWVQIHCDCCEVISDVDDNDEDWVNGETESDDDAEYDDIVESESEIGSEEEYDQQSEMDSDEEYEQTTKKQKIIA
jgi:hypothetical protein